MNEAIRHVLIVEDNTNVQQALEFGIISWTRPSPVEIHMVSTASEVETIIANPSVDFQVIAIDGNLWSGNIGESLYLFELLLDKFPHAVLIAMSTNEQARKAAVAISPKRIIGVDKGDVATRIAQILAHHI